MSGSNSYGLGSVFSPVTNAASDLWKYTTSGWGSGQTADPSNIAGVAGPVGSGFQSTGMDFGSAAGTPGTTNIGAAAASAVPGAGSGSPLNTGLGLNYGTGQLLIGGLGTIGGLWNAFQANKLANKSFNFQSGMANANLANSIQSYNTNLSDKANARYAAENNAGGAAGYIAANSLAKKQIPTG